MSLCILEPKAATKRISMLSKNLGFSSHHYEVDINHQIAIMWNSEIILSKFYADDQIVTMKACHVFSSKIFFMSFIYATCSKHGRRRIWEALIDHNTQIKDPWMIGGDFNVISSWAEKRGGRMIDDGSMMEFKSFIIQSGLTDITSTDGSLSWTNNQQGAKRIYKKLDRVFINSEALLNLP
uniref:Endonuclease/exonuclease/phosphatase domain-containing protein n=1 Tax=Kalanchoe fedtschenkoi TaxID=63787 RepID=A0A7N0ZRI2_KALFE